MFQMIIVAIFQEGFITKFHYISLMLKISKIKVETVLICVFSNEKKLSERKLEENWGQRSYKRG